MSSRIRDVLRVAAWTSCRTYVRDESQSPRHDQRDGIALEAVQLGIEVFKPLSEHSRCDLIFGLGDRLYRVQCKSARLNGEVLQVNLVSSWHTPRGYVRNKYSPGEVDLVAAHCHELDRNYLIPFDRVEEGKSGIHLR